MTHPFKLAAGLAAALAMTACAGPQGPQAVAQLQPTQGSTASGMVTFAQRGDVVRVRGEVRGLAPGAHGFHIHEKGDCSSGDGMSAGGHFNPGGHQHGRYDAASHHEGDLPSLQADASGVARIDFETKSLVVGNGSASDIIGHALIVHNDRDDFLTQPTGDSGARLACGVIVKSR